MTSTTNAPVRKSGTPEERISRLEALFEAFLAEWREERKELASDIHDLRADVHTALSSQGKINYHAVGVAISMIGMAAALIWTLFVGLRDDFRDHSELPGHAETLVDRGEAREWRRSAERRMERLEAGVTSKGRGAP